MIKPFGIFLIMLLIIPCITFAEIYKWINNDGSVGFTDNLSKVPEEYRDQVEIKNDEKAIKKETIIENNFFKKLEQGRFDEIKELISSGVKVNARNNKGETPLLIALRNRFIRKEFVEFLISNGADVNARNDRGENPLLVALRNYHIEMKIAEYLIIKGADVNVKDNNGITPLIDATYRGLFEIVKLLISRGADVDARDNSGVTPLLNAAGAGHFEIVKLLVSKDADVNVVVNPKGITLTPLSAAYMGGHDKIVEFLLSNGAREPNGLQVKPQTKQEIEQIIKSLWANFKDALTKEDIETALSYIVYERRDMYRYNFKLLGSEKLREIFSLNNEFRISEEIEPNSRSVECEILSKENNKVISHPIQFVRDLDGVWKIYFF